MTPAFWLPAAEAEPPDPRVAMIAAAMITAASSTEPPTIHVQAGTPLFADARATPAPVPSLCARRWFVSCFLALPILSHDSQGPPFGRTPYIGAMWGWTLVRFVHVTAAAVWLGMQTTLLVLVPVLRRMLPGEQVRQVVRRA